MPDALFSLKNLKKSSIELRGLSNTVVCYVLYLFIQSHLPCFTSTKLIRVFFSITSTKARL